MAEHYFEFRNVYMSFGDNAVLKDVSFFVEQGETAVIIGRSGVGKSVSLKLLLGFLVAGRGPDRRCGPGRYPVDRAAIFGNSPEGNHGVSSGRAFFDSMTVAENVAFPPESRGGHRDSDAIDKRVAELLSMLEASGFRGAHSVRLEHGNETLGK